MPFDLARLRAQLLTERIARGLSRATLAETSGINKTTIQSAEKGPDMPGIDTVAKLIEAMPGLTLSEFFLRVEEDVSSEERLRRAAFSLQSREALVHNTPHVSGDDRDSDASSSPQVDVAVARALIAAAETIQRKQINSAIASALGRAGGALLVEAGTHVRELRAALPSARKRKSKLGKPRT